MSKPTCAAFAVRTGLLLVILCLSAACQSPTPVQPVPTQPASPAAGSPPLTSAVPTLTLPPVPTTAPAFQPVLLPVQITRSGIQGFSAGSAPQPAFVLLARIILYPSQAEAVIQTIQPYARAVQWAPDGTRLAVLDERAGRPFLEVWDIPSGQIAWRRELPDVGRGCQQINQAEVPFFSWIEGGSSLLILLDLDHMEAWDAASGELTRQTAFTVDDYLFPSATDCAFGLAWAPDGVHFALFAPPGEMYQWTPATITVWDGLQQQRVVRWEISQTAARFAAFSPDSRYLAAGNTDLTIWDWQAGQIAAQLPDTGAAIGQVAWAPDGTRLAVLTSQSTITVYAFPDLQPVTSLEGLGGTVSFAWASGSRLVTYTNQSIQFHELDSAVVTIPLESQAIFGMIGWSPGGQQMALLTTSAEIIILDFQAGQARQVKTGMINNILHAQWLSNGNFAFFTMASELIELDPQGNVVSRRADPEGDTFWQGAWSPDGSTAVLEKNDFRTFHIVDPHSDILLLTYNHPEESQISSFTYSADGQYLAFNDENRLYALRTADGQRVECPFAFGTVDWPMFAWAPGSHLLAGRSGEDTLFVWDVDNPAQVRTWRYADIIPSDRSKALPAWTPDGSQLVILGEEKTYYWDIDRQEISGLFEIPCRGLVYSAGGSLGACFGMLGNYFPLPIQVITFTDPKGLKDP